MEEHQEYQEEPNEPLSFEAKRWGIGVLVLLLAGAGLVFGYGHRQGTMINRLASHEDELHATMGKMQGQLDLIAAKLNQMAAAQTLPAPSTNVVPPKTGQAARRAPARATTPEAERLSRLQTRIDQQQRQLKDTQDQVAQTRADLEGSLNSTRDELNGSIAKTHDELVALEKRGERNYFEFDLTKAKQYRRSGPVMLSLRKADAKHQRLDLAMIVNDNDLTKKNVNLYEPIWIYDTNDSQPVQVVVNKIDKDHVHGYVSAPKYSEAASNERPALSPSATVNTATTVSDSSR